MCVNGWAENGGALLRLAGLFAWHYNATCSARAFSRSRPASDFSEGETTP